MKTLFVITKCEKVELNLGHIVEVFLYFKSSSKFLGFGRFSELSKR